MTKEEAFEAWAGNEEKRKDFIGFNIIPPIWITEIIFSAGWKASREQALKDVFEEVEKLRESMDTRFAFKLHNYTLEEVQSAIERLAEGE